MWYVYRCLINWLLSYSNRLFIYLVYRIEWKNYYRIINWYMEEAFMAYLTEVFQQVYGGSEENSKHCGWWHISDTNPESSKYEARVFTARPRLSLWTWWLSFRKLNVWRKKKFSGFWRKVVRDVFIKYCLANLIFVHMARVTLNLHINQT
jgi:hypothetical protein